MYGFTSLISCLIFPLCALSHFPCLSPLTQIGNHNRAKNTLATQTHPAIGQNTSIELAFTRLVRFYYVPLLRVAFSRCCNVLSWLVLSDILESMVRPRIRSGELAASLFVELPLDRVDVPSRLCFSEAAGSSSCVNEVFSFG